jgi:hypothetical protein
VTHRHKKLEIAPVSIDLRTDAPAQVQPAEPTQEDVAKLAYSYYVARGYQPGNQADDWFRAVTELSARQKP